MNLTTAEFDTSQGLGIVVIADRTSMKGDKSKSKKRARRDAFKDDAAIEKKESRARKIAKKESRATKVVSKKPSMKEYYDSAFPADVAVDQDAPAYLMAHNYIKAYGMCLPTLSSNFY